MSSLVDIDPDATQPEEELGCGFGYYIFDSLPPILVEEVCTIDLLPSITITDPDNEIHLLLDPKNPGGDAERFLELLSHDTFCHQILTLLRHGKLINKHMYTIKKDILKRIMTTDNARFLPIVLPHVHIDHMLSLAHDHLGHNAISHNYAMVRRLYFWKCKAQTRRALLVTPFIIRQPIRRPCLLERIYKPMRTSH